jgi:hypothetical protein
MASNCRLGVRRFGHLMCRTLAGSGRVLCEGGIYIGGLESIGGRECNMMDPGCGSVRL